MIKGRSKRGKWFRRKKDGRIKGYLLESAHVVQEKRGGEKC
jgi:hypothetical protein